MLTHAKRLFDVDFLSRFFLNMYSVIKLVQFSVCALQFKSVRA